MSNKKKIIIIAVVTILIIWGWIRAFLSLTTKGIWTQEPINTENNNSQNNDSMVNKEEKNQEDICKEQYWRNATAWEPWYCACKEWYERNKDKTKCVIIIKDDTSEPQKDEWSIIERKRRNVFTWLSNGQDTLVPLTPEEEKKVFVEKNFVEDVYPDYKLEEWEELTVDNHSKLEAIHSRNYNNDEDYLSNIINDINTKKRFTENNNDTTTNTTTNTNNINRTQTLIENFIWSIESEKTNEGILYHYTFTDPSYWTTPIRIWFISNKNITNSDITTDIWWNGVTINKLKFHWWITNVEVTKDFWVTRCRPFEPEGYVFEPWINTFSLKGDSDGFTYINHLVDRIYPVFAFPRSELSQGNKNCLVEIWKKGNFSKFPFELKWSFENSIIAVTKNKTTSSNCNILLWNHDNTMVIYNEEIACELWYNNWTSLREITTK